MALSGARSHASYIFDCTVAADVGNNLTFEQKKPPMQLTPLVASFIIILLSMAPAPRRPRSYGLRLRSHSFRTSTCSIAPYGAESPHPVSCA